MKTTDFWDVTSCSLVEAYWGFGEMYCLHLQGQRVSQEINHQQAKEEISKKEAVSTAIFKSTTSTGLHGVTSRKPVLFKDYFS
jgi:hypothetical protein